MDSILETSNGVLLETHICPRAARDEVQGLYGGAIKIRLRAPPVDGKANAALVEFISRLLDIPKNRCVIVYGQNSRRKRLAVSGISAATVRLRLGLGSNHAVSNSDRQSS